LTAYDTKANLFSAPVRTAMPFTHAQPFGDHVYLTGRTFGRLPKKLWVVDQKPTDDSLHVRCPDTPFGRASEALLRGDLAGAERLILSVIDAGASVAVPEAKAALEQLRRLATATAASAATQKDGR
jgi:hypothetical protein